MFFVVQVVLVLTPQTTLNKSTFPQSKSCNIHPNYVTFCASVA